MRVSFKIRLLSGSFEKASRYINRAWSFVRYILQRYERGSALKGSVENNVLGVKYEAVRG